MWWKPYALSSMLALVVVVSRSLFDSFSIDSGVLILFVAVVSLCAWFSGLRSGLLLTWGATTALAILFLALDSPRAQSLTPLARFSTFLASGMQCCLVVAVLGSARTLAKVNRATHPNPPAPRLLDTALLQTASALRATEKHFHRLATAIPQVFWAAPHNCPPDYCNRQYYEAFGLCEATALTAAGLRLTVHPDDIESYRSAWLAATRSGQSQRLEYRLKSALDGVYRWHSGRFLAVCDEEGRIERWFNTGVDIEEQKRAERQAREAQRQLDSILTALPDPFFKLDAAGRFVSVNAQWVDAFGLPAEQVLQRSIWEVFPELWETVPGEAYQEAMREKVPRAFEQYSAALDQWFEVHVFPMDEGIAAHLKDITDRKEAEATRQRAYEELEVRVRERTAELSHANLVLNEAIRVRNQAESVRQVLQRRLATAQEDERSRIARELHDQMGQYVTALGMGLRALEESHPDCPQLRHLRNLTEVMGRDIHRLALELRPAALDDLGLATAIQNYLEDWTERSGVEIDYLATALESGRLPAEVEMAAYRIIQETLTNIVRHAEAKQVSVVIGRLADHLHLAVEDDGKGFDVEGLMASPEISQRLGLLGMHERIAQLKGVLSIESTPGKGTAVLARIPLNRDERSMDNEEAPRFSGR